MQRYNNRSQLVSQSEAESTEKCSTQQHCLNQPVESTKPDITGDRFIQNATQVKHMNKFPLVTQAWVKMMHVKTPRR